MAGLADFRKQYPEYNDLSDVDLADALYEAHYSDMPRKDFDAAVGIRKSEWQGFVEGANRTAANIAPFVAGGAAPMIQAQADAVEQGVEKRKREGVRSGKFGKAAGEFAMSLPLAYVGGPALSGALQGYATSDAETPTGKAIDTVFGAAGGKIIGSALDGVGSVFKPQVDDAVRKLASSGVKLTPGQIKGGKAMVREDRLMSRPVVGDAVAEGRARSLDTFNRGAIDEALKPLGIKLPADVPTGHDAVAFAQQTLDDAYNAVVPNLAVRVDPRFVAGMRSIGKQIQQLPEAQEAHFQRALKSIRFGQGSTLAGQSLKDAQSELGRLASSYSSSSVAAEREMGQVFGALRTELDDMILRQNPVAAPILKKVNEAYRGLTIIENAAKGADEGRFSTGQLKTAVRQGDKTVRKRSTAAGRSYMQEYSEAGRKVLPARTPDSGTAGRMMAASLPQSVFGAAALAGYKIGEASAKTMLASRPKWAEAIGEGVKVLKRPAQALAITAFGAQRP